MQLEPTLLYQECSLSSITVPFISDFSIAGASFQPSRPVQPVIVTLTQTLSSLTHQPPISNAQLQQAHRSISLIALECRQKRPPMDALRLVIKLQAFVLLSAVFLLWLPSGGFFPPLLATTSSWISGHPSLPPANPNPFPSLQCV